MLFSDRDYQHRLQILVGKSLTETSEQVLSNLHHNQAKQMSISEPMAIA